MKCLTILQNTRKKNNNCDIPYAHKTSNGVALGHIVNNIKCEGRSTTLEEKAKLDEIGFVWKVRNIKK